MGGVLPNESGVLLLTRKYLRSPGLEPYSSDEIKPPSLGEPHTEELEGLVKESDTDPGPLLEHTFIGLVADGKWETGREADLEW